MTRRALAKRAFTLIELLTVMAITAILLTLIGWPLIQSLSITRQAQAYADAQDKGRTLVERISREIGNAVSVRGISGGTPSYLNSVNVANGGAYAATTIPNHSVVIRLPGRDGNTVETVLPYSKLDIVPPAQGDPANRSADGAYFNPVTGKYDPTLTRPKGDVRLPVAPGQTIVRWFIGLRDPFQPYNEPYTNILMRRAGGRDNLYVLFRAEVQPYNPDGTVNTNFFRADASGRRIVDLDDPRFFVADQGQTPDADTTKTARVQNWLRSAVVQTEISRYDMIRPVTTGPAAQPILTYDATNQVPQVLPLIQFRPTRVASSPASGTTAARPGEAVEGLDRIGPDTFRTPQALWTNAIVRYYPARYTGSAGDLLQILGSSATGQITINAANPSADGGDSFGGTQLFDVSAYEAAVTAGQYAFTAAVNSNPAWLTDANLRSLFTPMRVFTGTGKIVTSFPVDEVGSGPAHSVNNVPTVAITDTTSPVTSTGGVANLSPQVGPYDPNSAFNYLWNTYPAYRSYWHRYIDLRFVPNFDGTFSPLCPLALGGQATGFLDATGQNRVRIVPGSEEVYGPNQAPGGIGEVRYTRVTRNPGVNQYCLVYADMAEPVSYADLLGAGNPFLAGFDPLNYNGTNVVSAAIQARYKVGYLQLNSDPNTPIPAGQIRVRYRFQLNAPNDTFAVDFDTRELMQVLLTIKNYPQSNSPTAQSVTLKSTATLRNVVR